MSASAIEESEDARPLDFEGLRNWPLPALDTEGDKEDRGRVLVVAGSREIAGAAILAATGALRAGAGKLLIAAPESVALALAIAIPESRVVPMPETPAGGLSSQGVGRLERYVGKTDAILAGPGLMDGPASCGFVAGVLRLFPRVPVVLDALAMDVVRDLVEFEQPVVMTPHAGEMAHLTGIDKSVVREDAGRACIDAAHRWNAVVALKGATTFIATPEGDSWRHVGGNVGLATSGSGDTLAGIVAGLAARGATLEQAAAWGVVLHACAGDRLADRLGTVGYMARELAGEIPGLIAELEAPTSPKGTKAAQ